MGQASQADLPVGAAIMPGEAADAAAASSPADLLPALWRNRPNYSDLSA
jgi:hypothetical protein